MADVIPIKKTRSIAEELQGMHDRVMKRAYEIFNLNGGVCGRELSDWLQAERELAWKPALELSEKDNELHLEMALPGVDPKKLDIEVTPEHILVKADIFHEHKEDKGEIHCCEFAAGNVFRSISLPRRIDPDKVKAEFKNGMLTLKAQVAEEARARKVAIAAA